MKNLADAKSKLSGLPITSLNLTYLNETDEVRETTLERTPLSDGDKQDLGGGLRLYSHFESRRLNGNIGYLHFTNFLAILNPRIKTAMESFKDARRNYH